MLAYGNSNTPLNPTEMEHRIDLATEAFGGFLDTLGFQWREDPNMQNTPRRVAKMYVQELFRGCYTEAPSLTEFPNDEEHGGYDNLIVVGPIDIKSFCAHHFLPIKGSAWIGVLPSTGSDSKLFGLSKYSRIARWYARRPQMQELLTQQILDHIVEHTNPIGAGVRIRATHDCMLHRGVEENDCEMITTKLYGDMLEDLSLKNEFLLECRRKGA